NPGARITTAALARASGVTEAALYRHFASKAQMFEALIAFAEETVFTRINQILDEEKDTAIRCSRIVYLLLGFAERNPGITRVLLGDALTGEGERLLLRVERFFDRLETQLKQVVRESRLREDASDQIAAEDCADIILGFVEGRLHRFLRSRFRKSPLEQWERQWQIVAAAMFVG
ncbi:MAG: nucleoid occlusion factor SlmA, partial [Gammaproteobacteria bacterium]|nr:nucleoid occlusion factor SlmA [Gammaproteobacteria bacterium]